MSAARTVERPATSPVPAEVVRSIRLSPSMQRLTVAGAGLTDLQWQGFDQWARLFLPSPQGGGLENVPERLTRSSYVRMLARRPAVRPTLRNYTLRQARPELGEVDIDVVLHGDAGVAAPWARDARPGSPLVLLDQGCTWAHPPARNLVLVADETALPAVLGILRDCDRTTCGIALVEVPDAADAQVEDIPERCEIRWLPRPTGTAPGALALAALRELDLPAEDRAAFAAGESALATGARRLLVNECGWDQDEVCFVGYWKQRTALR